MLWEHYVFRRGDETYDLWEDFYRDTETRLLYISGRGFDLRAQPVMREFMTSCRSSCHSLEASLLLIDFKGYELSEELHELTVQNEGALRGIFEEYGDIETLPIEFSAGGEHDISASSALRIALSTIYSKIDTHTDVVLDISSLPRVVYMTLITGLLDRFIPDRAHPEALSLSGVNFQILIAEDPVLDSKIISEDPNNDLILIPGFSSALQAESVQDWPLVWFPILGENRVNQFEKVMAELPHSTEICPVLPHPSRDPRRSDDLLIEFKRPLFDVHMTPITNFLYAHESHPFEAYRQLFNAMSRYKESLQILNGCRLVVTPLGSKLITVGSMLACFELKQADPNSGHGVAIPYSEPTRYVASGSEIRSSQPSICAVVLTGKAYAINDVKL